MVIRAIDGGGARDHDLARAIEAHREGDVVAAGEVSGDFACAGGAEARIEQA